MHLFLEVKDILLCICADAKEIIRVLVITMPKHSESGTVSDSLLSTLSLIHHTPIAPE